MKWLEKVRRLLARDYPDASNLTTVAPISSPKADEQDILTLVEHGYQLKDSGHLEDALSVFLSAHAKDPTSCVALNAIGLLYKALNRPQDALQQFRRALEINPRHVGSLCNAAAVLTEIGEPDAAIENCSRALEIEPGFEPALTVLALSLSSAGRHEEALTICDQLVSDNPGHIRLRRNRALTLQQLGRFDEALADFKRIVELAPEDQQARMSLALNALLCGDFADGWLFHEARWYTGAPDRHPLAGRINQASWDGQTPLSGKTILLHAEQGYGDTIQFSRYCRMVKARGARVLLGVPAAIRPLFRDLEGVDELIPDQRALPSFDEHSSLMSLPLAFSTRLDSIPEIGAKLAASSDKLKIWRDRLGAARRMRVAISWKGNPSHADDAKRSIQLDQFRSLFDLPIEFLSIQFAVTEAERLVLSNSPNVRDVSGEIRDFEDSAAVLECCDLIISVDSAPAHLAGAMDKPCWILIAQPPDWRWLLKREDSPWYPSVRLYRQPHAGEWATALEKLRADLSTLSASWVHP
jgi:tetratricopeptide (TPR) repeat protein